MKIVCPVYQAASQFPRRIAYRTDSTEITFAELERLVSARAKQFARLGIKIGDRVAIIASNSMDYVVTLFGLLRVSAVAVPLNLRMTRDDWSKMIAQARVNLILVDRDHCDIVNRTVIPIYVLDDKSLQQSLTGTAPTTQPIASEIELDQEATVIFTSGTSGQPRGVVLTFGNHYFNALGSNENIALRHGDCWLLSLPLYHVGGLSILFRPLLAGTTVQMMGRVDANMISELLDSGRITHLSLVPTLLTQLLATRQGRPFPSSLKVILLGGAHAPRSLVEQIKSLSLPVVMSYGMTETASQICSTRLGDPPERLISSGRPLNYRELRILDSNGLETARGIPGEIAVRGDILFKGYIDAIETELLDDQGWFLTGDIGYQESDGYLIVIGRQDEMLVSGGENIHPSEIEGNVESHGGVTVCKVIAVDDPVWGQRPVLFVETTAPNDFEIDSLREFLRQHLAGFKVPQEIFALARLPRNAMGKIDRIELMNLYLQSKLDK